MLLWAAEQATYIWPQGWHAFMDRFGWLSWLQGIFALTAWWQVLLFLLGYLLLNWVAVPSQAIVREHRHDAEQALFDVVSTMVGRVDDRQARELSREHEAGSLG